MISQEVCVLYRRDPLDPTPKGNVIPFRIAGDHFKVGWGRVETIPPALLFVDTGLAGAGVKLAESVIKQAKITLEQDKASKGLARAASLPRCPTSCGTFRSAV
jgi:hypothetical protein